MRSGHAGGARHVRHIDLVGTDAHIGIVDSAGTPECRMGPIQQPSPASRVRFVGELACTGARTARQAPVKGSGVFPDGSPSPGSGAISTNCV